MNKTSFPNVKRSLGLKINIFGVRIVINPFLILTSFLFIYAKMTTEFIILIASTTLHELCHTVVAFGFGYTLDEIELSPIGGVARLTDFDPVESRPEAEAAIAMAGPMGSMVLAILGYFLSSTVGSTISIAMPTWLDYFTATNVLLAIFNLIPVLPLDGGRILRCGMVDRYGVVEATEKVTSITKVIGVLITLGGIVGFYFKIINLNVCFIGLFITLGAFSKKNKEALHQNFGGDIIKRRVSMDERRMMRSEVVTVMWDMTISEAVRKIKGDKMIILMIVSENSDILGYVTESKLLEAAVEFGLATKLGDIFYRKSMKKIKG